MDDMYTNAVAIRSKLGLFFRQILNKLFACFFYTSGTEGD